MRGLLKICLICTVCLVMACQSPDGDLLIAVGQDGLVFDQGRVYPLSLTDTNTTTIFLATYQPTLDPDALQLQAESLNSLFRETPLSGIHLLNRPTVFELVAPLSDAHQLEPRVFALQDGPDVLDRLLLEEKGRPQLVITSVSARLAMISERIEPEWLEAEDDQNPRLVVIIHHPNAGIQLMKFPY